MDIQLRSGFAAATLCATLGMSTVAQAQQPPYPGYGYGPHGMWQQLTPEQQRQMWENMHRRGYGPGMMGHGMMGPGMMWGPGYGPPMTPEQYKQWWDQVHQRGYGPGMMHQLTPEQRQQMWEQMHRQGYGPWWMQPPPSSATPPDSSKAPPAK